MILPCGFDCLAGVVVVNPSSLSRSDASIVSDAVWGPVQTSKAMRIAAASERLPCASRTVGGKDQCLIKSIRTFHVWQSAGAAEMRLARGVATLLVAVPTVAFASGLAKGRSAQASRSADSGSQARDIK